MLPAADILVLTHCFWFGNMCGCHVSQLLLLLFKGSCVVLLQQDRLFLHEVKPFFFCSAIVSASGNSIGRMRPATNKYRALKRKQLGAMCAPQSSNTSPTS